ncbi:MAG: glycosyltransferase [Planctomycetes bacterium]|nr:glycosyltransferase [Planctomycetota bacterium]
MPQPAPQPKFAALFVSYNSGDYLPRAVHSLWAQRVDGKPADVEVVIVDNQSPNRESFRAAFEELRDRFGVKLIWHHRNDGYAAGMNLALSKSTAPFVLVTNPDVFYAPGCLEQLYKTLVSDRRIGMVGPMGFLDDGLELVLPINQLPTLDEEMERFRGRFSKRVSLEYSLRCAREMYYFYKHSEPRTLRMLSGASMMARRETIEKHGLFDDRFPLFYEDSDICHRYDAHGLDLVYVPRAHVTHYVSRSVASAPRTDDPMKRWAVARRRYFHKWYGPLGVELLDRIDAAAKRFGHRGGKTATPCRDLGFVNSPPILQIPGPPAETLIQIGLDAAFFLCATALVKAPSWQLSKHGWVFFNAGMPVFVRAIDTATFEVVGTWTFRAPAPK